MTRGSAPVRMAALLRAVNVGGHGKLPMSRLREFAVSLGLTEPETLLQTGNLVFTDHRPADRLASLLERELAAQLGVETRCFVRTGADLQAVMADNPFDEAAQSDPARLHVLFLGERPAAGDVAALQRAIRGRELVRPGRRELYLYYPDGAGRSKLTGAMIERYIGQPGTARNWNTLRKLASLTGS